jgi:hypothetical protein
MRNCGSPLFLDKSAKMNKKQDVLSINNDIVRADFIINH